MQKDRQAKRLYTLKEAAIYLGRSSWAVRELIWRGELPYIKNGKRILLDILDIDKLIEQSKTVFTY
ncbi:MAG: helix-turn-helix domain-containing protein [Nitrospirae bacterium]|nr:helix-turn-helix domain-containing protein [Nitrospirota bacterium]MCL5978175.1 helix-turn-helix domain-containing protein [Nitrospirota bacterium]